MLFEEDKYEQIVLLPYYESRAKIKLVNNMYHFSCIVSHKPPPLCVSIQVKAHGSHVLMCLPLVIEIAFPMLPPIECETPKFYSIPQASEHLEILRSLTVIQESPIHNYTRCEPMSYPNPVPWHGNNTNVTLGSLYSLI